MTRYNKGRLTALLIGIAMAVVPYSAVHAQNAGAGAQAAAGAQAGAQAGSQSASASGSTLIVNHASAPRDQNGVLLGSSGNKSVSEVRNVPNVSAPAVFGGGHPCLAGKSGGIGIPGAGASYGQGTAEPACMAWVMGQPEVALRIMMKQSRDFCNAVVAVGYYRVGNSVVPVGGDCGRTVKGGVETAGVASYKAKTKVKSSKSTKTPFTKCHYDNATNKLTIKYRMGVDKAAAKAECLASHGF